MSMKVLRNGMLVGQMADQVMQEVHKPIFQEGCMAIFLRWTALQLAIQNEWGGTQSKEKAQRLYQDVLEWFHTSKEREQTDLEDMLDEALQIEFNVLADDDSPYQISRSLCNMYNQVATGDYSYVVELRQSPLAQASACQQCVAPEDKENDSSSSEEGEEVDEDDDAEMDIDDTEDNGPVIDEDGFQLVQRKGRR